MSLDAYKTNIFYERIADSVFSKVLDLSDLELQVDDLKLLLDSFPDDEVQLGEFLAYHLNEYENFETNEIISYLNLIGRDIEYAYENPTSVDKEVYERIIQLEQFINSPLYKSIMESSGEYDLRSEILNNISEIRLPKNCPINFEYLANFLLKVRTIYAHLSPEQDVLDIQKFSYLRELFLYTDYLPHDNTRVIQTNNQLDLLAVNGREFDKDDLSALAEKRHDDLNIATLSLTKVCRIFNLECERGNHLSIFELRQFEKTNTLPNNLPLYNNDQEKAYHHLKNNRRHSI